LNVALSRKKECFTQDLFGGAPNEEEEKSGSKSDQRETPAGSTQIREIGNPNPQNPTLRVAVRNQDKTITRPDKIAMDPTHTPDKDVTGLVSLIPIPGFNPRLTIPRLESVDRTSRSCFSEAQSLAED
jgi:hypothetical protein